MYEIKHLKKHGEKEIQVLNTLRIFGSIAYAHVPHQGRAKLDDRSVKYVFVGYDASSKATNCKIQAITKWS